MASSSSNPLSLRQLCVLTLRNLEMHEDIERLPLPLKRYVASCLSGSVWEVSLWLLPEEENGEARELFRRYGSERRLYHCRRCMYTEHYCERLVIPRWQTIVYRFPDSDTSLYRCFCCGADAWQVHWRDNDETLIGYVLARAIDIDTVRQASRHSGYNFFFSE